MKRYRLVLAVKIYNFKNMKVKAKCLTLDELDELEAFNKQVFSDINDLKSLLINSDESDLDIDIVINFDESDFITNIVLEFNSNTYDLETLRSDILASLSDGWGENDRPFGKVNYYTEDGNIVKPEDIQTDNYYYTFKFKTFPPTEKVVEKYGISNLELVDHQVDDMLKFSKVLYLNEEEVNNSKKGMIINDKRCLLTEIEKANVKEYDSYYRPKFSVSFFHRMKIEQDPAFKMFESFFTKVQEEQSYYKDTNEIIVERTKYTVLYDLLDLYITKVL